jgi:hypothetical protein
VKCGLATTGTGAGTAAAVVVVVVGSSRSATVVVVVVGFDAVVVVVGAVVVVGFVVVVVCAGLVDVGLVQVAAGDWKYSTTAVTRPATVAAAMSRWRVV